MLSKQRVSILLGVLGLGLLVFSAIIASWSSPESANGQTMLLWLVGTKMNMENEFSRILILFISLGVALMGACLLVSASMMFFRAHLGIESRLEWDD